MQMHDYFTTLARYHVWATDKLLAQVAAISDTHYWQDNGLFFRSVHGTLNHMLVGELHWYSRFADGVSLKTALNAEIESGRAATAEALGLAVQRWRSWLATVPPQRYDSRIHYSRASGEPVIAPFSATLGHVFNHGTHHRGQISAALTGMGYGCPEMDIIYMLQAEMKKCPP